MRPVIQSAVAISRDCGNAANATCTARRAHLYVRNRLRAGLLQRLRDLAAKAGQPPQRRGLQQLPHRRRVSDDCIAIGTLATQRASAGVRTLWHLSSLRY